MRISKEVRVGILAAVAIAMFIVGYNYLRGQNIFTSTTKYYGVYDKVDGLFESNPVLINGYKVGHVSDVSMSNSDLKLTVEITVPSDIKVPINSRMKIVNNDMIGSKAIELVFGDSSEYAKDGQYLASEQDAGITEAISSVLTPLSAKVNSVLSGIDTAVSGADLSSTLRDMSSALKSFKETADKLNSMLQGKDAELDAIFANIKSTSEDLKKISPRIASITTELEKTSKNLSQVDFKKTVDDIDGLVAELSKVSQAINSGEGTMGKLVNDEEMYTNLNKTIVQLEVLVTDMQEHPCRYFALTAKQRKKCEEDIQKGK